MSSSKVIGNGTFGCVFKPALTCKNNRINTTGKVGKVVYDIDDYNDEVKIGEILEKLRENKDDEYFVFGVEESVDGQKTRCDVNVKDIPNINACNNFREDVAVDTLPQILMEDGGQDLISFLNLRQISRKGLLTLLLNNVFYAVRHLVDNGYVHQDIKASNILISKNKNNVFITKLADFGTLIHTSTLETRKDDQHSSPGPYNYLLGNDYYLHGPEYAIKKYNYAAFDSITRMILENLKQFCSYDAWKSEYNELFPNLPKYIFDKNHLESLTIYLSRNLNTYGSINLLKKGFMNPKTTDVFSLGVTIMWLRYYLIPLDREEKSDTNKQFLIEFYNLLYQMMNPNPFQRITIHDLIKKSEELLQGSYKGGQKRKKKHIVNKVLNPKTGRYVKKDGKIGRNISNQVLQAKKRIPHNNLQTL